ncbi:hypothetical protein ACP70R_009656 [Stipagrostis hirtigluma subsp. patula]
MLALAGAREPFDQSKTCLGAGAKLTFPAALKLSSRMMIQEESDPYIPLLPGLPDELAKICLALVPRSYFPAMGAVSKRWMTFIGSREFIFVRKELDKLEEWIYVLTAEAEGKGNYWEVLGSLDQKNRKLPPMPGPAKAGFGVVVLGGKLFVMAGYAADLGKEFVSDEVYQYDACLNRWAALARMNVARRDFACAEVDGVIYVAGGVGPAGDNLSSVEAYDPHHNAWTLIQDLRRPRWGCFAFASGSGGKLYVMGGRSSFTIGNSRFVDVYDPARRTWGETKNGCVMVTSHAVVGERLLFCIEWRSQRTLAAFDPADGSWRKVPVPLTGSSSTRLCLGVIAGKVLLFSTEQEPGYQTLVYDPAAPKGSEWGTCELKPSGMCICSVTIEV